MPQAVNMEALRYIAISYERFYNLVRINAVHVLPCGYGGEYNSLVRDAPAHSVYVGLLFVVVIVEKRRKPIINLHYANA